MNKKKSAPLYVKVYFLLWILFFAKFWSKALFFNKNMDLVAGHVNIWGDWAAHFTMANAMAHRGLILLESPFLIGAKFSYPFVADMLSAALLQMGVNLRLSFLIPSFFLSIFLVWALYFFYRSLSGKNIMRTILSSLIFMLNGGVGFYFWWQELKTAPNLLSRIINPLHEYTRLDSQNIKWINVMDSMVIPQRAFLLGFPLTLVALTLIYKNFFDKNKNPKKWIELMLASTILGLMPIIHTHSFLAAFVVLVFWTTAALLPQIISYFKNRKKTSTKILKKNLIEWGSVAAITSLIALPILNIYFFSQISEGFIKFFPGWLAKEFEMNWFVFWFKNWFLVPPLALLGYALIGLKNKINWIIWGPFVFLFFISNLFLFQPFAWDNTKLLVWSSVGFSYLVAFLLEKIWSNKKNIVTKWKKLLSRLLVTLLFAGCIASGALDAYWLIRHKQHNYIMYNQETLTLVDWVKENTSPNSIWLTGEEHNHFLFNLTGRQSLMTYRGWLWTHGYDYQPIERDVANLFKNPQAYLHLIDKYQIDYIVVGPNEKRVWKANSQNFSKLFKVAKKTTNYQIFETGYN